MKNRNYAPELVNAQMYLQELDRPTYNKIVSYLYALKETVYNREDRFNMVEGFCKDKGIDIDRKIILGLVLMCEN